MLGIKGVSDCRSVCHVSVVDLDGIDPSFRISPLVQQAIAERLYDMEVKSIHATYEAAMEQVGSAVLYYNPNNFFTAWVCCSIDINYNTIEVYTGVFSVCGV